MELFFLGIGVLMGGAIGWFMAKSRFTSGNQQASGAAEVLKDQLGELNKKLETEREKVIQLTDQVASARLNAQHLEEKKKELETIHEKLSLEFKNLANEIFETKSQKFTEQNKSNIFDLLKPLGEKITQFEKKIEETNKESITRSSALREQLENLQRLNLQMTREAENLTRALKGDSKTQGAWGEFILESILEKSGLERDREYTLQESFSTSEGRLRPDAIIRLPDNRHVIIDSKVSLTAYNSFVNSATDEEKATALKAHLISIRQHMKGLSEKSYQDLSENGLDFIIMFIPIEPAYILAIQSEKSLYEEALEKRIVFVSPTLLIPSLQLIKNVWKQEYQNRHVIDIANKAGDLYDKFVGFTEDMLTLGRHLDQSKKHYEESMKKLSVGSGNVVRKIEELKKLGAKASKSIDQKLLGRSEEQKDLFD
jgi:DNA recombination protein RmuC